MRDKVKRELNSLLDRVSGLPENGAGMAELQSILKVVHCNIYIYY